MHSKLTSPTSARWSISQWEGSQALELVCELNRRCINLLVESVRGCAAVELRVAQTCAAALNALDEPSMERAASVPVLLLDLQFSNVTWWRTVCKPDRESNKGGTLLTSLPATTADHLMHDVVTLAWHIARTCRPTASVLLGMARDVGLLIADFGFSELEQVCARGKGDLCLRWDDAPEFWRTLLNAARHNDDEQLCDVHLHSLQRLGSTMLALRR